MKNLKFIHNTIVHWIDKTDSKANIVLGFKIFLIGYFLTMLDSLSLNCDINIIALILYIVSSLVSFVSVLRIVNPTLSTGEAPSLIYFKHISHQYRNKREKGVEDLIKLSDKDFKIDIANQIISLALVAEEKYQHLQKAIIFLLIEVVTLIYINILLT